MGLKNKEPKNKKELVCALEDWQKEYGKKCNKCDDCGKVYKLPNYIFYPRNQICFTCECKRDYFAVINKI